MTTGVWHWRSLQTPQSIWG